MKLLGARRALLLLLVACPGWAREPTMPADAVQLLRDGNPVRAVESLRRRAANDDLGSEILLASVLEAGFPASSGPGIASDPAEAIKFYEKAAQAGHEGSMKRLGILYAIGRGAPRDAEKSLEWFRKAGVDVDKALKEDQENKNPRSKTVTAWRLAYYSDLSTRVHQYPRESVRNSEEGTVELEINAATHSVKISGGTAPESLKAYVREVGARGLILVPPPDDAANPPLIGRITIDYRIR